MFTRVCKLRRFDCAQVLARYRRKDEDENQQPEAEVETWVVFEHCSRGDLKVRRLFKSSGVFAAFSFSPFSLAVTLTANNPASAADVAQVC